VLTSLSASVCGCSLSFVSCGGWCCSILDGACWSSLWAIILVCRVVMVAGGCGLSLAVVLWSSLVASFGVVHCCCP